MKITKLGHCCLLIETKGKRILTDPGSYTVDAHSKLQHIDFILYTHEHFDHFHLDSVKILLEKNPQAAVYANSSVSDLLSQASVAHTLVHDGENFLLGDVPLTGIGELHAVMHSSIPQSSNIGFYIDERLWYPGDAFTDPKKAVEILALPVSGPWMKIGDAIDYAILVKPRVAFPVHDGTRFGSAHALPARLLPNYGIEFVPMTEGDSRDF